MHARFLYTVQMIIKGISLWDLGEPFLLYYTNTDRSDITETYKYVHETACPIFGYTARTRTREIFANMPYVVAITDTRYRQSHVTVVICVISMDPAGCITYHWHVRNEWSPF